MKNKKMLSLALAVAMTATMSMSAFAAKPEAPADATPAEVTDVTVAGALNVTSEATTAGVTLTVKLPASADLVFNPYKLENEEKQVLAAKAVITNTSNVDVNLYVDNCYAIADTAANKAIKIAPAAPKETDVTNTIQLFLRAAATDPSFTEPYSAATAVKAGDVPVVLATAAPTKTAPLLIAQLAKTSGAVTTQFGGSMVAAPTVPWTAADKLAITTVYRISPTTITP